MLATHTATSNPLAAWLIFAVCWVVFGCIAYSYGRYPYKWSKRTSLLFALGGVITALGAVFDVFMHTSMGGDYTRNWKNDPEPGTGFISWKDIKKLRKEESEH